MSTGLVEALLKAGVLTAIGGIIISLLQTYTNRRANAIADQKLILDKSEANRKGDIEARNELRAELDRLHRIRLELEKGRDDKEDRLQRMRDDNDKLHLLLQERLMLCAIHGNFCTVQSGAGKASKNEP